MVDLVVRRWWYWEGGGGRTDGWNRWDGRVGGVVRAGAVGVEEGVSVSCGGYGRRFAVGGFDSVCVGV